MWCRKRSPAGAVHMAAGCISVGEGEKLGAAWTKRARIPRPWGMGDRQSDG